MIWEYQWYLIFCITSWWIWKWRNCQIFKEQQRIPFDKYNAVKNFVQDCKYSWSSKLLCSIPYSIHRKVNRQKPPRGWLKLNVDGTCNQEIGAIGAGGVFRDRTGKWMFGFINNIGIGSIILVEAWAVLSQIAIERGFTSVIIESDSLELEDLINKSQNQLLGKALHNIITDIKHLLNCLPHTRVIHCYRESNGCADFLAKLVLSNVIGLKCLENPPTRLQELLQEDQLGVAFERECPVLVPG